MAGELRPVASGNGRTRIGMGTHSSVEREEGRKDGRKEGDGMAAPKGSVPGLGDRRVRADSSCERNGDLYPY